MKLLEIIISLALGLLLISMAVKVYSLQLLIHHDIQELSSQDEKALIVFALISHRPHDNFYVQHHGLFLKKPGDNAVEIISGVQNFSMQKINNTIEVHLILSGGYTYAKRICVGHGVDFIVSSKSSCLGGYGNAAASS